MPICLTIACQIPAPAVAEKYKPFTEFPTPELLARAQVEYSKYNEEHAVDSAGIPLPFPPSTNKSHVFNVDGCKDIDNYARNVRKTCNLFFLSFF